jgi:hypothetical protein
MKTLMKLLVNWNGQVMTSTVEDAQLQENHTHLKEFIGGE